jgi:protein-L-isoaspartate(D-aspartate) O-methyltransferase
MMARARRSPEEARAAMVARQLRDRGIADERVLAAMGEIPRERFLPEEQRRRAYQDRALSVGHGQTISQPWIVAAVCQALELDGTEKVLEVGTGTGYSAAVLSRLGASVISIERIAELAERARATLAELGDERIDRSVEVVIGDGSIGLPDRAPFDAIVVHAATPAAPVSLLAQLAVGGILVAPVAEASGAGEILTAYRREGPGATDFSARAMGPSRFVPLIGDEGFDS